MARRGTRTGRGQARVLCQKRFTESNGCAYRRRETITRSLAQIPRLLFPPPPQPSLPPSLSTISRPASSSPPSPPFVGPHRALHHSCIFLENKFGMNPLCRSPSGWSGPSKNANVNSSAQPTPGTALPVGSPSTRHRFPYSNPPGSWSRSSNYCHYHMLYALCFSVIYHNNIVYLIYMPSIS